MVWATNCHRTRTKTRSRRVLSLLHSKRHKKVLQSLPDPAKVRALRLLLQPRVKPASLPPHLLHLLRVRTISQPLQKRRMMAIWIKQHQNLKICRRKYRIVLMEHRARPLLWLTWLVRRRKKKNRKRVLMVNCPIKIS